MINFEFESIEELRETIDIVSNACEKALNENERYAQFTLDEKEYKIDTKCENFKAGFLYGISVSKNLGS